MSQITYAIERSSNRKHTYITIQKDGSVLVKANPTISEKAIEAFVAQKRVWILRKVSQIKETHALLQESYNLLGERYERGEISQEEIDALYREKVQEIIPPLVTAYSEKMCLYPTRLSFRNNKTRWGSCSAKDALTFNIQLAQTPLSFIEYVVVHELAHIRHKNHSKAFWALVQRHLPDYKERQRLVRERCYLLDN